MPRLENWSLGYVGESEDNTYLAPELAVCNLSGNVYGHPDFDEGEFIHTSRIMKVEGKTVQTRNTLYELGQVCTDYLAWYKANVPDGKFDLESDDPFGDVQPDEEG